MKKSRYSGEPTEIVRQSIIEAKSGKNCLRDYSGEIFELTKDMLANEHEFNQNQAGELSGIAECILQKYSKLLSLQK